MFALYNVCWEVLVSGQKRLRLSFTTAPLNARAAADDMSAVSPPAPSPALFEVKGGW